MRRNLIRADLKRAVSTFEPTSAACGEAIPSRSRGRANRRRRRPNVLQIPVVRDQAREPRPVKTPSLGDLGDIAEGDAVVHEDHGIGRYRGLKKLDDASRAAYDESEEQ